MKFFNQKIREETNEDILNEIEERKSELQKRKNINFLMQEMNIMLY